MSPRVTGPCFAKRARMRTTPAIPLLPLLLAALAGCGGVHEAATPHEKAPAGGDWRVAGAEGEAVATDPDASPAQRLLLVLVSSAALSSPDPIPTREGHGRRAPPPCEGSPDPIPVRPNDGADPKAIEAEEPPCDGSSDAPCGCVEPAEDDAGD